MRNKRGNGYASIVIGTILILFIVSFSSTEEIKGSPNSEEEIINNCKNLGLEKTARCLNSNIKTFYRYNNSRYGYDYPDEKYYERLNQYGGICDQWARYYVILSEKLGFHSEEVVVSDPEFSHAFAIISNKEGYCILEQSAEVKCYLTN